MILDPWGVLPIDSLSADRPWSPSAKERLGHPQGTLLLRGQHTLPLHRGPVQRVGRERLNFVRAGCRRRCSACDAISYGLLVDSDGLVGLIDLVRVLRATGEEQLVACGIRAV